MLDSQLLLCIDYGSAKVGVAVGSITPSSPLAVVRFQSKSELLSRLQTIIDQERPVGIVIGWPADHLTMTTPQTETIRQFGEQLSQQVKLPVVYHPETLTTQMATQRMLAAGISKSRRREVEDSFAAAAILDDYLVGVAL